MGCLKDKVYRALREYGIGRRPHAWQPRLERYEQEFLKETVNNIGYTKGALE